jgi:hypothetical protein
MIQSYIPPTVVNGGLAPVDRSQNLTLPSSKGMTSRGKQGVAIVEVRAEPCQLGWCGHGGHDKRAGCGGDGGGGGGGTGSRGE